MALGPKLTAAGGGGTAATRARRGRKVANAPVPGQGAGSTLKAPESSAPQSPDVGGTLRGLNTYLNAKGRQKDPLVARGGKVTGQSVTRQGPRAGRTRIDISHNGAKYHVYYSPDGKREVLKVSPRAPAATAQTPQPVTRPDSRRRGCGGRAL